MNQEGCSGLPHKTTTPGFQAVLVLKVRWPLEVLQTTLKVSGSLEGHRTQQSVILMVILYDRGRTHISVVEQSPADQGQASRGVMRQHLALPAMVCDSVHEALPTRSAHPSPGVQGFYWRLLMSARPTLVT